MDILTTRELQYMDDNGDERNVLLTIFTPWERVTEGGDWRGACAFGPPIARLNGKTIPSGGVDVIQCFVGSVHVARGYLMGSDLAERAHWKGMRDCGLPWHVERPIEYEPPQLPPLEINSDHLAVLATRLLECPDELSRELSIRLTFYTPQQEDRDIWKCAFSLSPSGFERPPVRYGVGADFIESFLDALTLARVTYEALIPKGWTGTDGVDFGSCYDFPYKIGREYFTEPSRYSNPDMPDFWPSWMRDRA